MKKIFLTLLAFVIVGAGCIGGGILSNKHISGDWVLTFDLPDGWVMTHDYDSGSATASLRTEIEPGFSDVVIQSTDKLILLNGKEPDLSKGLTDDDFISENYIYIRVLRLDERRVIPSEAKDLGNGFSFVELEAGEGVYYLQVGANKYQFIVEYNGQLIEDAEQVIFSAQEVTEFSE